MAGRTSRVLRSRIDQSLIDQPLIEPTRPRPVTAFAQHQRFSIGRAPECDLVIADASVSRRHAELVLLDGGRLYLVDCKSTHGTRLTQGGTMRDVRQEFVEPGAVVTFGDVSMPVRDLLDALRAKHPGLGLADGPRPSGSPPGGPHGGAARRGNTWARGTRLVRCACGVVKAKGHRCPECGE